MALFGGDTPLYDCLRALADKKQARFHMPGHKGLPLPGGLFADTADLDFTELDETGNLYLGDGPIARSEALTAQAFGAESCLFLTGGSSQGIMASLGVLAREGDIIIADRNCHRALHSAMALLGLHPVYVLPEYDGFFGIPAGIIPEKMSRAADRALALADERKTRVAAAIVTSPTYHGLMLDLPALADTLHEKGIPLIVDAAHGAHLPFMGYKSAIQSGADIEICSGHKTLPVLGQGAWLLLRDGAYVTRAREAAAIFGTSSPSYAVMASMDIARAFMLGEGGTLARQAAGLGAGIRDQIARRGIFVPLDEKHAQGPGLTCPDPLRLTVNTAAGGLSGRMAAEIMKERHGVVCEMSDARNMVFIISPADTGENLGRLAAALAALPAGKEPPPRDSSPPPPPVVAAGPREALFAERETVLLAECGGRVCAQFIAPYPPGVPVIAPGEIFTKNHIAYLGKIGYNEVNRMLCLSAN